MEKFYAVLESLPTSKSLPSRTIEENIALIDARCQYLKEVNAERAEFENMFDDQVNLSRIDSDDIKEKSNSYINGFRNLNRSTVSTAKKINYSFNGLLITCTDEKGND